MAEYLGQIQPYPNTVADSLNQFAQQTAQRKQSAMKMALDAIQSGQYAPAQGQQQAPGMMQKVQNAFLGPQVGGPNMNVMGANYQQVTPEMKAAALQKSIAMIQGMGQNPGATQATTSPSGQGQGGTGGLPTSLPAYQVTPDVNLNDMTASAKMNYNGPLQQAEYQDKLLDIQSKQQKAKADNEDQTIYLGTPEEVKAKIMKSDPGVARVGDRVIAGDLTSSDLPYRDPVFKKKVLEYVSSQGIDEQMLAARKKMKQDFTTGVAAKNIKSLNTAVGHLQAMSTLIPQLHNSGIRMWNQLAQTATREFGGNPNLAKFKATKVALSGELSNIYKNSGGTDQEIKQVSDSIDSADSTDTLNAAVQQATVLMGSRLNALQDQWHTGFNRPGDKDFPVISPENRKIIDSLGYESPDAEEKKSNSNFKAGQTRVIGGVTYTRDENGNWSGG